MRSLVVAAALVLGGKHFRKAVVNLALSLTVS